MGNAILAQSSSRLTPYQPTSMATCCRLTDVFHTAIVPILLNALKNPTHHTTSCLETLIGTQFVHFIDSPSLALVMPVVTRAIEDRTFETRKKACQIIGNMYSLTDQKVGVAVS